jgi:hypothetical protein
MSSNTIITIPTIYYNDAINSFCQIMKLIIIALFILFIFSIIFIFILMPQEKTITIPIPIPILENEIPINDRIRDNITIKNNC